jgi:1,2-phenylacetyl-CoA epoxidase catalytic subunit
MTDSTEPTTCDVPYYFEQSWDQTDKASIQNWLDHSVGRRLQGSTYGIRGSLQPRSVVWADPLVNQIAKLDIATFLIGERHSIRHTAAMVNLAPDERSQAFLASQVLDEARHFEAFSHRMAVLGVAPPERETLMSHYNVPEMQKLFDVTEEQIDKGFFEGAVVGQNLIIEGMAFPIYRYESRYWSWFDPGLSQVIRGAFADEVAHTWFGEAFLRSVVADDVARRNRINALVRDMYQLMQEMFQSHIRRYVSLYQAAANEHMNELGDIMIFKDRKMSEVSEEEQIKHIMNEVAEEYRSRSVAIGLEQAS